MRFCFAIATSFAFASALTTAALADAYALNPQSPIPEK